MTTNGIHLLIPASLSNRSGPPQKLAEEIERLREICAQGPYLSLHEILCDYRDWLCRRALVDECEDLE